MKIKRKNKIRLIGFLIITIILFTSFKPINVSAVDDNYSTYLYNQDINVANDKAHLLSEQSDGSNSYRNLFQSNFLFPAKLQSNMLSTSQTSSFSHYSFNQFYFDNLDNKYAYQSNDNSENFKSSIIPNDFDVINGTNIVNGSLENQDSSFGKYNTTYSFDNYSETESNYGNYNGTYSFENEIGLIGTDISFIDYWNLVGNIEVMNEIYNHKSSIAFIKNTPSHHLSYHNLDYGNQLTGKCEFWISSINTFTTSNILISEGNTNAFVIFFSNNELKYIDNLGTFKIIDVFDNLWYHINIQWYNDNTFDITVNGNLEIDGKSMINNMISGINRFRFYITGITTFYLDAYGIDGIDDYNENDNTNPYGLQTELENDFSVNYRYNIEYSIENTNSYHNNVLNLTDYSTFERNQIYDSFSNQPFGIIEFALNCNNTQIYSDYLGISTNYIFGIRIANDKFGYYNGSWQDLSLNINDNQWYNVKIYFESSNSGYKGLSQYTYSVYIDNIYYITSNFAVNQENLKMLRFASSVVSYNYYILIDNLDYSWSNGYYENRIQDLIPLNDSNYNMYKSEVDFSNNGIDYIKYATYDIQKNWISTLSNHYEAFTLPNPDTVGFNDEYENYIDEIGFGNIYQNNSNIYKIKVNFNGYCAIANNDYRHVKISLFNSTEYSDYQTIYCSLGSFNVNYEFTNLNISQFNISLRLKAPSSLAVADWLRIYELNIEIYHFAFNLEIESEKEININLEKAVLFTLYYSFTLNINNSIIILIYNYDTENYYEIENLSSYFKFEQKSFIFNESAYFRFNKFKIFIKSESYLNFNIFIDSLFINITNIIQNNEGYHEIIQYNHRYDNSDNYKGYSKFELQIYNNSIKYRYSEINFEQDDYIYAWITYNTSNIDVKNIELQSHVRFGLNTLDIEIINFYYIIYINYNNDYTIEFREQSRKELATHKIKSSFNYTSYTRNYLDLTGIIGNYSYNTFKGCRSLYGATTEIFHRNFIIPYFSDDIDVSIPLVLPDDSFSNPNEPTPPTEYYWEYETFKTEYYRDININIGNWTVQFSQMRSSTYQAKYFYQPNSVSRDQLGSWKWKIKFTDSFSYTVDFNFIRNAIVSIINLVFLFAQWMGYLALASASYVFMYLGTTILVFLWNTLVYSLFYALIYVMWYLYVGIYLLLFYIWEGLVWVYENLLIPFLEWFWNECIPWIIDFIIVILAHIITLVIFAITLGRIDYDSTYDTVYLMLRYIADEIIEVITVFIKHLDYILLFVLYYLLLVGLLYLRYIYVKARGFNNRGDQLYKAFEVFSIPIVLTIDLFRQTKELVNPYS